MGTKLIDGLNEAQRDAVTHRAGPILIIAGAGTGKTTVIARRIAWLLQEGLAKSDQILALTFTDKAAGEMEERVDALLPYGSVDIWISTFHAFAERMLKEYGLAIGIPNDFRLLDETAQWLLIREHMDRFPLDYYRPRGNPTKYIRALLKLFSRAKDEEIRPNDFLEYVKKMRLEADQTEFADDAIREAEEIANCYHAYEQLLLEKETMDFGGLMVYFLELLRTRPRILKHLQERFPYILVDEFQDTNWAQYELVKLLAGERRNLAVVGDDDQSIYKFRGASVSNILQFKKDFSESREVVLTRNYRSRQNILDLAYRFIQNNNPNRLEAHIATSGGAPLTKKLESAETGEGIVEHLHFQTIDEEVRGVVEKIRELMTSGRASSWSDFAVLTRSNDAAIPFANAFQLHGIPYQFLALRGLYTKPVVLDVINYLKLLDNYHESTALFRILNAPFVKLPNEDLVRLTFEAQKKTESLHSVAKRASSIAGMGIESTAAILRLLTMVETHASLARQRPPSEVCLAFMKDSGYLELLLPETKENREALGYLEQFMRRIKSYETRAIDPRLSDFMRELSLEIDSGESGGLAFDAETGPDMVRIMTIHGAKGLEFPYVFVVNMVEQRFPTIHRRDPIELPDALVKETLPEGDIHLEEERRLCYVAITRAKHGIFFSSAEDYGGARKKKPSRFLAELGFTVGEPQNTRARDRFASPTAPPAGTLPPYKLPAQTSYTQFVAFETCPLQYKFAHLLRIPVLGKFQKSFGSTIHATLEEFMRRLRERTDVVQQTLFGVSAAAPTDGGLAVSEKELFEMYEKQWQGEWFLSAKQKDEFWEKGKEMLKKFYATVLEERPRPLLLEEPFKVKLGASVIKGKIDRVDRLGDKGVEIIDYKTGKKKEKLEWSDKRQLLLYQIAMEERGLIPERLTYYYLEDGARLTFLGTAEEKEKVKTELDAFMEDLRKGDFTPTPGIWCGSCDFRDICEYRA